MSYTFCVVTIVLHHNVLSTANASSTCTFSTIFYELHSLAHYLSHSSFIIKELNVNLQTLRANDRCEADISSSCTLDASGGKPLPI